MCVLSTRFIGLISSRRRNLYQLLDDFQIWYYDRELCLWSLAIRLKIWSFQISLAREQHKVTGTLCVTNPRLTQFVLAGDIFSVSYEQSLSFARTFLRIFRSLAPLWRLAYVTSQAACLLRLSLACSITWWHIRIATYAIYLSSEEEYSLWLVKRSACVCAYNLMENC